MLIGLSFVSNTPALCVGLPQINGCHVFRPPRLRRRADRAKLAGGDPVERLGFAGYLGAACSQLFAKS
jgi:hypothetical protein